MKIIVDTREKSGAIQRILRTFDRAGIEYCRRALKTGDYMLEDFPGVVIDRKQNLEELSKNLTNSKDRSRFWREVRRAYNNNIKLVVLCEHGGQIKCVEDVRKWRDKYSGVPGRILAEKMQQLQMAYGVDFVFCDKRVTGKKIIEILTKNY